MLSFSFQEQTYALLGLREGEETLGWQEAWREADRLSGVIPQEEDEGDVDGSDAEGALPLSEAAGADFDRLLLTATTNTTLKPQPTTTDYSSSSLPKRRNGAKEGDDAAGSEEDRRSCVSEGLLSIPSSSSLTSPNFSNRGEAANNTGLVCPTADECTEARRAVFAQHRVVTMRRLGYRPTTADQHCQNFTLAVPASSNATTDDGISVAWSIQHSGSLNNLTIAEECFGTDANPESTLFEQVGHNSPNARLIFYLVHFYPTLGPWLDEWVKHILIVLIATDGLVE